MREFYDNEKPVSIAVFNEALLVFSIAIIAIHTIHSAKAAAGRVRNDCVPLSGSGNNIYGSWFSIRE